MDRGIRYALLAASIALGCLAGAGAYTFHYGHGTSYLSSDPKACVNCHIMRDQYDSWRKASHHAAALCVDCHLPQALIGKWIAKSENGWNHSKAFTLQDFHEPIAINPKNSRILQDNCVRCHEGVVSPIAHGGATGAKAISCVSCHRAVGHGG